MDHRVYAPALLSFLSGLVLIRLLLSVRLSSLAVDVPNERSLHDKPIPRTGGLAIVVASSIGVLIFVRGEMMWLWTGAILLGGVSFVDDRRGLPVSARFAAQAIISITAIYLLAAGSRHAWWALPVGSLAVVWMTNLYNFMDGADGLAGGMALSGFAAYAVAGSLAGHQDTGAVSASIAGASTAFLSRNFPPARIFMGDVGSTVLGYWAAVIGLRGVAVDLWPLWFPPLVFLPFIADATVTLLRRALNKERLWQAHRNHYYQRLIRSGWNHTRMASTAYVIMFGCAVSALLALRLGTNAGWAVLAGWVVIFAYLMRSVDARWARYRGPGLSRSS